MDRPIEWEVCFLQLRKITELIALGCLVAHGDIEQVHGKALSKAWKPKDIVDGLEKLHPKFFPVPAECTSKEGEMKNFSLKQGPYLTKDQMLNIYGKAGDALHSGNLRAVARERTVDMNFRQIHDWTRGIVDLLALHFIFSRGGGSGMVCQLKDPSGNCSVKIFHSKD